MATSRNLAAYSHVSNNERQGLKGVLEERSRFKKVILMTKSIHRKWKHNDTKH